MAPPPDLTPPTRRPPSNTRSQSFQNQEVQRPGQAIIPDQSGGDSLLIPARAVQQRSSSVGDSITTPKSSPEKEVYRNSGGRSRTPDRHRSDGRKRTPEPRDRSDGRKTTPEPRDRSQDRAPRGRTPDQHSSRRSKTPDPEQSRRDRGRGSHDNGHPPPPPPLVPATQSDGDQPPQHNHGNHGNHGSPELRPSPVVVQDPSPDLAQISMMSEQIMVSEAAAEKHHNNHHHIRGRARAYSDSDAEYYTEPYFEDSPVKQGRREFRVPPPPPPHQQQHYATPPSHHHPGYIYTDQSCSDSRRFAKMPARVPYPNMPYRGLVPDSQDESDYDPRQQRRHHPAHRHQVFRSPPPVPPPPPAAVSNAGGPVKKKNEFRPYPAPFCVPPTEPAYQRQFYVSQIMSPVLSTTDPPC
eukprot:sb/3465215/